MAFDIKQQREFIIRVVRIGGGMLAALGLFLYFDVGGLSSMLGVAREGIGKLIGPILVLVGFFDIVLVPTVLGRIWGKTK